MTEPIAAAREHESPAAALGNAHMRVAILDTDSGFLQVLGKRLERLGWEHRVLASPVPIEAVVAMRLNAIVIDLAVLGPQAWDYLEKLCAALPGLGVVVCTAQSTVAQRVRGLRMGADDWLTKPCHPEELLARVEAVVRRRRRAEAREERAPIQAGEVEIRADRFQAYVNDASVDLTRREFELIELLAGAEGRVLEREEIYQRVWGYAMARGDRSVDVFVRKLRQKLEKASPEWRYIHTHFGVGYRFSPEAVEGSAAAAAIDAAKQAEPVDGAPAVTARSVPGPPDGGPRTSRAATVVR
jgi:DNA-binding response OmpR family regulator